MAGLPGGAFADIGEVAPYSGVATAALTITGATLGDGRNASIGCEVSGPCGAQPLPIQQPSPSCL